MQKRAVDRVDELVRGQLRQRAPGQEVWIHPDQRLRPKLSAAVDLIYLFADIVRPDSGEGPREFFVFGYQLGIEIKNIHTGALLTRSPEGGNIGRASIG